MQVSFRNLVLMLLAFGCYSGSVFSNQKSEKLHICFFSLNTLTEIDELEKIINRMNRGLRTPSQVTVQEYQAKSSYPAKSFEKMIKKNVTCDGLVISGHHTGSYGGKRSWGSLKVGFIEKLSCNPKYQDWFLRVKSLWLQGCRTLGTREALTAAFHANRVSPHRQADGLEDQTIADLHTNFSDAFDQDDPLSSRYSRSFPSASIFGWTKSAPGREAGSSLSIPYHLTHIANLNGKTSQINELTKKSNFPFNPHKKNYSKSEAKSLWQAFWSLLGDKTRPTQEIIKEAWIRHGGGATQAFAFDNPDLNAYVSLVETQDEFLKGAKSLNCELYSEDLPRILRATETILKEKSLIRYSMNTILALLKVSPRDTSWQIRVRKELSKKLVSSSSLKDFLIKKIGNRSISMLRKLDYYSLYWRVYSRSKDLEKTIYEYSKTVLATDSRGKTDSVDFKSAYVETLFESQALPYAVNMELAYMTKKDSSPRVRAKLSEALRFVAPKLELLRLLRSLSTDRSDEVRIAAAQAAKILGGKALSVLRKLQKDKSPKVRESAGW